MKGEIHNLSFFKKLELLLQKGKSINVAKHWLKYQSLFSWIYRSNSTEYQVVAAEDFNDDICTSSKKPVPIGAEREVAVADSKKLPSS